MSWLYEITGAAAIIAQIKKTGSEIMAKLDEIKAQIAQANEATNDIANDIRSIKTKLDEALSNTQGQVDAAVQEQLQEVSDALSPLVTRLEDVAGETDNE